MSNYAYSPFRLYKEVKLLLKKYKCPLLINKANDVLKMLRKQCKRAANQLTMDFNTTQQRGSAQLHSVWQAKYAKKKIRQGHNKPKDLIILVD